MFPSGPAVHLNLEAISGICGSVSIACWVVVFSPQIIENFHRGSADGISLLFLIIWLAGDVFNILGAVLQGVLPTMIILALYYTLADIVLLCQCFYYRSFSTSSDSLKPSISSAENRSRQEQGAEIPQDQTERTPLLTNAAGGSNSRRPSRQQADRRSSIISISIRDQLGQINGTHLSPAVPLIEPPKPSAPIVSKPTTTLQKLAWNAFAIALVCASGVLGWYISVRAIPQSRKKPDHPSDVLRIDTLGQIFGYLCAVLYLGSRVPQLLLNWRRKSTEGVSLLFFLFACIGNLTYVLSIFAYSPACENRHRCRPGEAKELYARYLLVNASWLLGSMGTLVLDMGIFAQFILYRDNDEAEDDDEVAVI